MRFIPGCLLLLLLVSSLSPAHGVLETLNTSSKCRCMKSVSFVKRRSMITQIAAYMPGDGCPHMEVIVWLKNRSILCLNPKSKWTQNLLVDLQRSHILTRERGSA
ncbi:C-X-C motif chemokine 13 [Myotis myotis]|uniref:C-X-C motif chemokine ligand 13 n=1 Tax=Myotis myotis TaxID=51298 RepID=A0A7J8AJ40_MYOMY|nr:C-X-C motif chemokine 13 [Myotis myotis]KAF6386434.1 C-X-C motif chemokine ligand 13 [Myotis myotis]